ncbi:MAG: helix-hairpin-helix domain-containing protein [Gammaproteobacteria bacterium]|nr:helix-hairpin-helix domain-containing protein [Gammaproteobacteria bacterium]
MGFSEQEKQALLAIKGVGPTVISRLEEIGIDSCEQLSHFTVDEITRTVADMLHTSCWKNSPQAKNAIRGAIERAKELTAKS